MGYARFYTIDWGPISSYKVLNGSNKEVTTIRKNGGMDITGVTSWTWYVNNLTFETSIGSKQSIKMAVVSSYDPSVTWYASFNNQGIHTDGDNSFKGTLPADPNASRIYTISFEITGESDPEDPDPEPDLPEQPEIPEPEPGVTYYNLTIQAMLGSDGEDQIYFYPYAEGTELNPYEDIFTSKQLESLKNAYEGYQYVSGIDDLDTDIVMNDNHIFWIYYAKIPEAETQTMTMVIVNNCKGFKVIDSSGNKLLKGANSEGIAVGSDSIQTNQIKELTRDVITGEILTLTHYGYTSTDAKWYQFNGWYYIDKNSGEPVDLGNKRTITFQVPPADSWTGAVYCKATKINSGTFDWDEAKVTGYQFNLTANEWLRLVDYIEAKKNDGGDREYYKDQIHTDQNFTAQMFNAVAIELGLTVRGKNQIIKASYFDEIKKAANNMAIKNIWT